MMAPESGPVRGLPRLCAEAIRLVWAAGRREVLACIALAAVNGAGLGIMVLLGGDVLGGNCRPIAAEPASPPCSPS